jgi:hypothetical protein
MQLKRIEPPIVFLFYILLELMIECTKGGYVSSGFCMGWLKGEVVTEWNTNFSFIEKELSTKS